MVSRQDRVLPIPHRGSAILTLNWFIFNMNDKVGVQNPSMFGDI